MIKRNSAKALIAVMAVIVFLALIFAVRTHAENEVLLKVRFGTVEQDGYSMRDAEGVVRGFDAEYMAKISQYGMMDLQYSFYDNFEELMNALESGEIDMAAGIAKTEEREEKFIFSADPFMIGAFKIAVNPENDFYEYGNPEQISGMKLGVTSGSYMAKLSEIWESEYGSTLNLVEFESEQLLKDAVDNGKIDGMVVSYGQFRDYRTIYEKEANGYYVCMNRDKPDLKRRVDQAMNRIIYESPNYVTNLRNKYREKVTSGIAVTEEEKSFIQDHFSDGLVNVAVMKNDPPYYSYSEGEEKGIIPEFYGVMSERLRLEGVNIRFTYIPYNNYREMYEAVLNGEADVVGFTNMDASDASAMGCILTAAYENQSMVILMPSGMRFFYGADDPSEIPSGEAADGKELLSAAQGVDADKVRHYLKINGINSEVVEFDSLEECYTKIFEGGYGWLTTSLVKATWLVNQHRCTIGKYGLGSLRCGKTRTLHACITSVKSSIEFIKGTDIDRVGKL